MSVEQQHSSYRTTARHRVGIHDPLYLCYALLLVVAVSTVHLMAPVNIVSYERDVWHHLAVLNELLKSPFHAVNPHVLSDAPSRTFMPWYVLLALVGRSLGLTAKQLLGVSAVASMIVLVIGIRLFARAYFASVWAPLTLLTVTFATWAGDFNHTGYHTLSTLLFSVSYPFGIVLASGFVSWWLVLRALRAPNLPLIEGGAIILLTAFMYATHQLQAGFAIGGMMTFALFHGRYAPARRGQIVTAIVAGLLLCRLWPYFDPLAYTLSEENITYDYKTNINWTSPWVQLRILGLTLLGLAGLYDFRRKAWRWDLTIAAGTIAAGIGAALVMGLWIGLRFLPFLVAILQIALTAFVLDLAATKPARTPLLRSPLGGVLCLLYAGWLFNIALAANSVAVTEFYLADKVNSDNPDWSRDISDSMSTIRRAIGPGRVILAEGNLAYPVQANEMKVVSIPRPFPEVPDSLERQAASKAFFADATSNEERCRIIARYDVAAILYRADRVPPAAQAAIAAFGTSVGIHDLAFLPMTDAQRHRCNGTGASQQP